MELYGDTKHKGNDHGIRNFAKDSKQAYERSSLLLAFIKVGGSGQEEPGPGPLR